LIDSFCLKKKKKSDRRTHISKGIKKCGVSL
jgi:hypothetical protein